jgi:hypothetical protein
VEPSMEQSTVVRMDGMMDGDLAVLMADVLV